MLFKKAAITLSPFPTAKTNTSNHLTVNHSQTFILIFTILICISQLEIESNGGEVDHVAPGYGHVTLGHDHVKPAAQSTDSSGSTPVALITCTTGEGGDWASRGS